MSTQLLDDIDVDHRNDTEEGKASHIVKKTDDKSAAQIILEARIYGLPVEALCGRVFVPQRDPKNYPVCDTCKEIAEMYQNIMNYGPYSRGG